MDAPPSPNKLKDKQLPRLPRSRREHRPFDLNLFALGFPMTTAEESTRNLFQAGAFLVELALDERLPIEVRREAARLTRHYPTPGCSIAVASSVIGHFLPQPESAWCEGYRHGPLTMGLSDRISRLYHTLGTSQLRADPIQPDVQHETNSHSHKLVNAPDVRLRQPEELADLPHAPQTNRKLRKIQRSERNTSEK